MSMGSSLTHIRATRGGRKGDSARAVSQQERWIYAVWLGPQEPAPVHVGAHGATEWGLAATLASPGLGLGTPSKSALEGDVAVLMT